MAAAVLLAVVFLAPLTTVSACKDSRKSATPATQPAVPTWAGKPWDILLPNGTIVELIGFAQCPSDGQDWWTPDGRPLPERPYEKPKSPPFGDQTWENRKTIEMAYRTRLLGDDRRGPATMISMSENMGVGSATPVGINGLVDFSHQATAILFRGDQETVDITISTAAGDWTTIGRGTIEGDGIVRNFAIDDGHGDLRLVAPPQGASTGTNVTAIMDFSLEDAASWQFVAVDKAGLTRKLDMCGMSNVTEEGQPSRRRYDLELSTRGSDIAAWKDQVEIRFDIRKFHYVVFQNVSLVPGKITDVRIVTGVRGESTP